MKWFKREVHCKKEFPNTLRTQVFTCIKLKFNFYEDKSDQDFIDKAVERGRRLATKVYPGSANESSHSRKLDVINDHCLAGVLAEEAWLLFLNRDGEIVESTNFTDAAGQIDLMIKNVNKRIEIRSSFTRNGVEFAICHQKYQFDILGPYANSYKPSEIEKDYYVRTLFHLPKDEHIVNQIYKADFTIVLAGRATWQMMIDDNIAIDKDLLPEGLQELHDEVEKTSYRVVPYSRALDTLQILDLTTADSRK